MQQQGAESVPEENVQSEKQEKTFDEVPGSIILVEEQKVNPDIVTESVVASSESQELKTDNLETPNDDSSSDSPSTRSKTLRQSSKKKKVKDETIEFESEKNKTKIQSESNPDNVYSEAEIKENVPELNNDTKEVEENTLVTVVESEDRCVLAISDESGHVQHSESQPEDKSDSSQEAIVEEEISMTASVSCEERSQLEKRPFEEPEKYLLSVSSSELQSRFNGREKDEEFIFRPEYMSVTGSSWGGNIRSVSARKPVGRGSFVIQSRSISVERHETGGNHNDADSHVHTTEGNIFASLKRKAFDNDTSDLKKRKTDDSKNYKIFSIVSSPLRLLKNKLSDRIVETSKASDAVEFANVSDDDESLNDKIKEENLDIKEKLCIMNDNQNASLYQSWCNVM